MKKHTVTHKINKTFFPSLRDLVRILSNNCDELRSTFRLYNKWVCVPAALKHTYSGRTCLADGMYTGSGTHSALYRIQDTRIFLHKRENQIRCHSFVLYNRCVFPNSLRSPLLPFAKSQESAT